MENSFRMFTVAESPKEKENCTFLYFFSLIPCFSGRRCFKEYFKNSSFFHSDLFFYFHFLFEPAPF